MLDTPQRKISRGTSSLRGKVSSIKNQRLIDFESALERDFIRILEFNPDVQRYCEQPCIIEYLDNGVKRTYTPDFIVYYKEKKYNPLLCEIKYSKDLMKDIEILTSKMNAGVQYANHKNWDFRIITEKDIYNDYFHNICFLSRYTSNHENVDLDSITLICEIIKNYSVIRIEELLQKCCKSENKKAEVLYTLWYMIGRNMIPCDLTKPINLKTEIWGH